MAAPGFSLDDFNPLSSLFRTEVDGPNGESLPLLQRCSTIYQNLKDAGENVVATMQIVRDEIDPLLTELALNQRRSPLQQIILNGLSAYRVSVESRIGQQIPSRFINNHPPIKRERSYDDVHHPNRRV